MRAKKGKSMAVVPYEPVMRDHELLLWLLIYGHGHYSRVTAELCFDGLRYACRVDLVGLPELTDHARAQLREFHKRMKPA